MVQVATWIKNIYTQEYTSDKEWLNTLGAFQPGKEGTMMKGVQDHELMETPGRDPLFYLFPFQNLGASNGVVSGSNEG